jgi:hypothetical protein
MMNAELVAGGEARMIIPTVFRDDYLGALRRLTRSDDPSILIKALRFTHDYTANIDFSSVRVATEQLSDTNALTTQTARHAYVNQRPPQPSRAAGRSRPEPR